MSPLASQRVWDGAVTAGCGPTSVFSTRMSVLEIIHAFHVIGRQRQRRDSRAWLQEGTGRHAGVRLRVHTPSASWRIRDSTTTPGFGPASVCSARICALERIQGVALACHSASDSAVTAGVALQAHPQTRMCVLESVHTVSIIARRRQRRTAGRGPASVF
jgi:hypothetical protein